MKKLLLILAFASFAFSCGDDDSGSGSSLKPTSVTIGDADPITFAYDDEDRVQSVSIEGTTSIFTYDDENRVDKVTTGANFYQFTYDADGKYTGIVDEQGAITPLVHINDNDYTANGTPIGFESNGDWQQYTQLLFNYSNKKGPFANVRQFNAFALTLANNQMLYFASKKRRVSITSGNIVATYTATEGEKGLPATETVDGGMIAYQYSE